MDLGGSPIFFREERRLVIDYTASTWIERPVFIFCNPQGTSNVIFLLPFSNAVWILIIIFGMVFSILLYGIRRIERNCKFVETFALKITFKIVYFSLNKLAVITNNDTAKTYFKRGSRKAKNFNTAKQKFASSRIPNKSNLVCKELLLHKFALMLRTIFPRYNDANGSANVYFMKNELTQPSKQHSFRQRRKGFEHPIGIMHELLNFISAISQQGLHSKFLKDK